MDEDESHEVSEPENLQSEVLESSEKSTEIEVENENTKSGSDDSSQKLRNKLRVEDDEEILLTRRPSFFAFVPIYFIGLLILGIHLFFGWAEAPDDAEWYQEIFYFLVHASGWAGGTGFAFVMLFFTWINRAINHSASGKWVTIYLLIVSITPFILHLDDFIHWAFDTEKEYIPFDFNFTFFGILWAVLMWAITFWYQKSFLYAVTSERIIHTQNFIYERDGHRILHEDIIAVHKLRSPIGAIFGYATVYCNIGDQSHIASETTGIAVGVPGSTGGKGFFGFLRKLFFIVTYQRTVKTERFTPDISFYGIRQWEEVYDLINKLQRENSSVSKADAQLEALQNIQEMLGSNSEETDEDLNDLDDLLSEI
jgi:hypothetical protein